MYHILNLCAICAWCTFFPTPGPMCVLNSHSWFVFDGHWSPKSNAKYRDYLYTNGKLTRSTWASFYFTEKQKVLDSKPLLQTGLHPLHRSKEETQWYKVSLLVFVLGVICWESVVLGIPTISLCSSRGLAIFHCFWTLRFDYCLFVLIYLMLNSSKWLQTT